MVFLLAERPDERDIPDVISIVVVNEIVDSQRDSLSLQSRGLHRGDMSPA
jgi:hypothetical protein